MFYAIGLKKAIGFAIGGILILAVAAAGLGVAYISIRFPLRYLNYIEFYSAQNNLSVPFVCAVIHAESRFRREVRSHRGASGLMQITEPTAYWLAELMGLDNFSYDQILTPELNIQMGTFYLRRLLDQFGGKQVALAAYNAGSGNVTRWLQDSNYSIDGRTLYYIPFGETRTYVQRVARNERIYTYLLRFHRFLGGIFL